MRDGFSKQAGSKLIELHHRGKLRPALQPTLQSRIVHQEAEEREPAPRCTKSFFTSLGIFVPPGQEFARARVWPVLSRERDDQKEILVNVKNNEQSNLPLHIRCMSASEEEWTPMSTLEDLAKSIESEFEEKILRFSVSLKGRLALEWNWQEDQAKGG